MANANGSCAVQLAPATYVTHILIGPTEQQHVRDEVDFQVSRMRRRWARLRDTCAVERRRLRTYLIALKRVEAEAEGAPDGQV